MADSKATMKVLDFLQSSTPTADEIEETSKKKKKKTQKDMKKRLSAESY